MGEGNDRMREIRERFAELQRENEAADAAARETTSDETPTSPITPGRRRGRRGWLFIAGLLVFIFVVGELALTVQGWSSPDFSKAQRIGQATVVSCERRGPIGRGFGYWDRCTADILWDGGFSGRYTFNRRNFIHADEVGKTITIGEHDGTRATSTGYSRPEAPHRPLVAGIGVVLTVAAMLPALFLAAAMLYAIRDMIRGKRKK